MVKRVLFVCTENSCRSQMAEAWFRHLYKGVDWVAESAGTSPTDRVNPLALKVLEESGVDVSGLKPKMLDLDSAFSADKVITMGCVKGCPITPADKTVDWGLDDPAGKPVEEFRKTGDEIRKRVEELIDSLQ